MERPQINDKEHIQMLIEDSISTKDLIEYIPRIADVVYPSDPLKQIYRQIREVIYLSEPGCWFEAASGAGKSTTIEYCKNALKEEFPELPVVGISEHVLPAAALRSFFIRMLEESKAVSLTGETARLRIRLAKHLSYLGKRSRLNTIVMLVDEGQAFRDTDLFINKDLFNDVKKFGGNLLTIIFGEKPKMASRVSELLDGDNGGLAQRFVGGRQLYFSGYTTVSDWESLFKNMDDFPIDIFDGKPLAHFFFQRSDISRFKFAKSAGAFFEALRTYKDANNQVDLRKAFAGFRRVIYLNAKDPPKEIRSFGTDVWKAAFSHIKWHD